MNGLTTNRKYLLKACWRRYVTPSMNSDLKEYPCPPATATGLLQVGYMTSCAIFLLKTSFGAEYIGDSSYDAVWAELNQRQAVVFLHGAQTPSSTPYPHAYLGIPIVEVNSW